MYVLSTMTTNDYYEIFDITLQNELIRKNLCE